MLLFSWIKSQLFAQRTKADGTLEGTNALERWKAVSTEERQLRGKRDKEEGEGTILFLSGCGGENGVIFRLNGAET